MSAIRTADAVAERAARSLTLAGRVQGIGVRPAIARLAAACCVAGFVTNRRDGVEITVEGRPDRVEQFVQRLPFNLPSAARVDSIRIEEIFPSGCLDFSIVAGDVTGPLQTQVPRDVVVCRECLDEIAEPDDRRHNYAFTSCTNCGPRFSIVKSMPYERADTGMAGFQFCQACRAEYTSPGDRRFHAQTNACPECGPHVWCRDREGRTVAHRDGAVAAAIDAILSSRIVAVRGGGGYQLVCDATSAAAVSQLRDRKRRVTKPLAVMVEDLPAAERLADVCAASRRALAGPENTIVLMPARPAGGLAAAVHPGLDLVGLMLPTTPLHWLLVHGCGRPLVVTSGNREGEPLATEIADAEEQLAGIADLWLHHNRPIAHALDDSVVRVIAGRTVTLRLARGLAPLSLDLPSGKAAVALGGHQKSAIAIANGAQAILAPHVGDLDMVRSRERFVDQVTQLAGLYGTGPGHWIHDLHPDYFTTRWAREQPGSCLGVQHHHAHVAAAMLEHGWLDREVLGVAFDGTGFGPDGTIWGGEFLIATASAFRRVAHLRPFRVPGGEAAIREPWRVAVSLIHQAVGERGLYRLPPELIGARAQHIVKLLDNDSFSPRTTSAGRLFDGVAALILNIDRADFEGAPAMLLEAAADASEVGSYEFPIVAGNPCEIDWRPMVRQLLADLAGDVPRGTMAMRFHRGLAGAVAAVCRRFGSDPVVLTGGVFQNRILTELIADLLASSGQPVGLPGVIPPNDGGLAAGQLAIALAFETQKGGVL
ncbi:MAG: carbamoyltransferase HypF [Planctomycetia bacterium]|nr:carbamoyltransferase HypF [Planctomycetia bacterium]